MTQVQVGALLQLAASIAFVVVAGLAWRHGQKVRRHPAVLIVLTVGLVASAAGCYLVLRS